MRRALILARRGWGRTAPNPMVGAVVVRDGKVVGEGFHAMYGGPHAETVALDKAGAAARGADVYVTLEPCAHHGKTPPCADALIAAGVRRVIIAVNDPDPQARGGADRLRAAGIIVDEGIERIAASDLNAPFLFVREDASRPFVTLKLAISLDGAIAAQDRAPRWLTGEASRREVHHLRAGVDAVAVGVGTAIADDPQLTVRTGRRPRVAPTRVVFDRDGRLPLDSRLVRTARKVPTIIVSAPGSPSRGWFERAGATVLDGTDVGTGLRALRAHGIGHVLVEGGAGLAGALLTAGLVDRLVIFRAPVLLGAGALPAFGGATPDEVTARWRVVESRAFGDDEMTVYAPSGR
jgi:diaminohydroxyphosphoribosylaminopyrimidine deaminase/5-amino-6-(5-phosphoribosylamino)uracil reductase